MEKVYKLMHRGKYVKCLTNFHKTFFMECCTHLLFLSFLSSFNLPTNITDSWDTRVNVKFCSLSKVNFHFCVVLTLNNHLQEKKNTEFACTSLNGWNEHSCDLFTKLRRHYFAKWTFTLLTAHVLLYSFGKSTSVPIQSSSLINDDIDHCELYRSFLDQFFCSNLTFKHS